jgi:hypothetical protein
MEEIMEEMMVERRKEEELRRLRRTPMWTGDRQRTGEAIKSAN